MSRTASVGYSAILGVDAATSQDYVTWTCGERLHPRFLYWVLQGERSQIIGRMQGSTHKTIYMPDIEELTTPVPPLAEQRAIADHLDTEAARIDALITKKQQLIHLLEERWTSAVARAVAPTGSLTSVSLDESWPTAAFGSVVRIAEGQVDPRIEPWASMPLVAPNHIESRTGRLLGLQSAAEQGAISGKYVCEPGDVIYSKIRPALAKAVLAAGHWLCSADMYPLRAGPALRPEFLRLLVLSPPFTDLATVESDRVAMPKINRDALGRVRVPIPSLDRQDQIVTELAGLTAERDRLTEKLATQVELLAERRSALVAASVTGQNSSISAGGRA